MQKRRQYILLTAVACVLGLTPLSRAEEGGSAHYLPGVTASFIDAFPGVPGSMALLDYFGYYDASASASRPLVFGSFLAADTHGTVYANSIAGIYQAPWNVLGGGLALGLAVPYVWMEVDGKAQRLQPNGTLGPQFNSHDTANGLGDMTLIPFILGWTNLVKDLKVDTRFSIYAPTGDYDSDQMANVGKNYWTFEPGIMLSWLSTKIGAEVSFYTGLDFNTENSESDYTSGDSLHLDLTVAQHLPLCGGLVGIGANAFYYKQITGDSGSGAKLGGFLGKTMGVGPVLSYVHPVGNKTQLVTELKWLPELNVDRRLEGDFVWFKCAVLF